MRAKVVLKRFLPIATSLVFLVGSGLLQPAASRAAEVAVSVVTDDAPGPGASHGAKKILAALKSKGISAERVGSPASASGKILIVAGLASGSGPAAKRLEAAGLSVPDAAEALLIRRIRSPGKPVLLVAGRDDRGLMYAELDVAERIGWATDPKTPLSEVRDAVERPAVSERALSIYTMHRKTFESYFYDEAYWAEYLDMLARNRFNTFVLIFGYENAGYFAPPYPFFFDVESFPEIHVVGITPQKRRKNLEALNRIIEMTHQRGLDFTLGIWDHIYRGGVQGPTEHARRPTEGVVWGLTQDNLVPYTKAALRKFLSEVPNLDAIQFRMHGESGLRRSEMEAFWTDVYRLMKQSGSGIRFDARAKNFPDSLIDRALETGVDMRICTKYWMEQMGLPFHPTHVHPANQHDRRHGYADLLRYPKRYDMHWRLWSGGTTRVFLWGDPEYVRRFARSTHLYDGQGFEVTAPMATKMQDHPHDLEPFELLRPEHRYYRWEFERYWHFFQVFGRMGYNPDTPPEVWQRQFQRRFGKEAAPYVERALHRASHILPRIVAYQYPYNHFPTTRGWVERQRQEDLPTYAKALPSDTEQFCSVDQAAQHLLEGEDIEGVHSAKILPRESSAWFARAARDVLQLAEEAEKRTGTKGNKEFHSTMVDLRMLAHLAQYHSHRAVAGMSWALFNRSGDLNALDDAIRRESRAAAAWQRMVEAAGDVYHDDVMMGRRGSDLSGHWRDELVKLNKGLERLRQVRRDFKPKQDATAPTIAHVPVRRISPGKDLVLRATVGGPEKIARARVGYTAAGGETRYQQMKSTDKLLYRAAIPASEVAPGLKYHIEVIDAAGRKSVCPAEGASAPTGLIVTDDNRPPAVSHTPIANAPAEKPLTVTARVTDPAGVKWVRLRYRSVTQYEDYKTLAMLPTDEKDVFRAVVPAKDVAAKYDFMYFIEVMDNHDNGQIHPDLEKETPYIVVRLSR